MQGGEITQSGSYEELLTAGMAFEQLVNAHRDAMTALDPSNIVSQGQFQKVDTVQIEQCQGSNLTKGNSEGEIYVKGVPGIQLTEKEERENGDCWYSFLYGVNLHVPLMFFTLLNNSAKQQNLGTLPGVPLRCLS
jgi:ATP-binding cassette subfamily C (CFTR/MRP) protein 1